MKKTLKKTVSPEETMQLYFTCSCRQTCACPPSVVPTSAQMQITNSQNNEKKLRISTAYSHN